MVIYPVKVSYFFKWIKVSLRKNWKEIITRIWCDLFSIINRLMRFLFRTKIEEIDWNSTSWFNVLWKKCLCYHPRSLTACPWNVTIWTGKDRLPVPGKLAVTGGCKKKLDISNWPQWPFSLSKDQQGFTQSTWEVTKTLVLRDYTTQLYRGIFHKPF